jgi:environmental stress-induced protein Ves
MHHQYIPEMIIRHIKSSELITTRWAGGTTTQLVIYPANSQYQKRDFKFRLSTATVECEESTFTVLPEVQRKLMILNGEIKIVFNELDSRTIRKFDQVEFQGAWHTKSYGKAIDFNLMTNELTSGKIETFTCNTSIKKVITNNFRYNFIAIYAYIGQLSLNHEQERYQIKERDVCIIQGESGQYFNIILETFGFAEIIITYINCQ